jgi:hypothetical protein
MKEVTRHQLIELLAKMYPKMFLSTTEEFNGDEGGIWTSGEDAPVNAKGLPIFDYYTERYDNYDIGIESKFSEYLDKLGWYCEWYDPGTIMIYPNF